MSMRIFNLVLLPLIFAGCSSEPDPLIKERDGIACKMPGNADFDHSCTVERSKASDGALVLTIRHADGVFRRLRVVDDGRGVIAADGAEQALVTIIEKGLIAVTLAGAVYHLPVTVGS